MCSYCGCESEAVIAGLMADHEMVGVLAHQATSAHERGDTDEAVVTSARIAALFDAHGEEEETGLFAELKAQGLALDAVARLEADHHRIGVGLGLLAAGDTAALPQVLAELLDHAEREDTDLFPAALQLLPDECWARIKKIHNETGVV